MFFSNFFIEKLGWLVILSLAGLHALGIELVSLEVLMMPIFVRAFLFFALNNLIKGTNPITGIAISVVMAYLAFLLVTFYAGVEFTPFDWFSSILLVMAVLMHPSIEDHIVKRKKFHNYELLDLVVIILLFALSSPVFSGLTIKLIMLVSSLVIVTYVLYLKLTRLGMIPPVKNLGSALILSIAASVLLLLVSLLFSQFIVAIVIAYIAISNLITEEKS